MRRKGHRRHPRRTVTGMGYRPADASCRRSCEPIRVDQLEIVVYVRAWERLVRAWVAQVPVGRDVTSVTVLAQTASDPATGVVRDIDAVTAQDLLDLAQEIFAPESISSSYLLPAQ